MHNLGFLLEREKKIKEAEEQYRKAIAAGQTQSLLSLVVLLPEESPEKDSLYRRAWESGVKDADVFYAIFLFSKKRGKDAIEVENIIEFDVQEEVSDDEFSAKADSQNYEIEENLTQRESTQ